MKKIYLIEKQLRGYSKSAWETLEVVSTERRAIERKIHLQKLDPVYSYRVSSHIIDDYYYTIQKISDFLTEEDK